jgi:hypothetical protein
MHCHRNFSARDTPSNVSVDDLIRPKPSYTVVSPSPAALSNRA